MKYAAACAVLIVSLAGCGGGGDLASSDPNGYEACSGLAVAQSSTDAKNKMGSLMSAGESARQAASRDIRESVEPMFDEEAMGALEGTESEGQNFFVPDVDKLEAACSHAGFDF